MNVYFFTGIPNRYDYIIAFIDKYLIKQNFSKKVSIYIPNTITKQEFIYTTWNYQPKDSFISIADIDNINSKHANIIIYQNKDFIKINSNLLINLSDEIITTSYENIAEFIDISCVEIGRHKYKEYLGLGVELKHKPYKNI